MLIFYIINDFIQRCNPFSIFFLRKSIKSLPKNGRDLSFLLLEKREANERRAHQGAPNDVETGKLFFEE
jgi:hypothetical protein